MTRDAGGRSEVHIHVKRLVIDGRAADAGVRDLRDGLTDRIGRRLEDRRTGTAVEPGNRFDVGDAIADAIAVNVAPTLRRVETRTSFANGMKR